VLSPQCLDQPIGRDDPIRVQEKHREERPLLGAADVDRPLVGDDLERPENPKLHRLAATLTG
jgi:hypothetical protein